MLSYADLDIQSFIHFPISTNKIVALTDANRAFQDQSVPNPKEPLPPVDLHFTPSTSGHIILLEGPLQWKACRQTITARSTAESEIYATNNCVKEILHLSNTIQDLILHKQLMPSATPIITRNIRPIQIRENVTREAAHNKKVKVEHNGGKDNPPDIFAKERKDTSHFLTPNPLTSEKVVFLSRRKLVFQTRKNMYPLKIHHGKSCMHNLTLSETSFPYRRITFYLDKNNGLMTTGLLHTLATLNQIRREHPYPTRFNL